MCTYKPTIKTSIRRYCRPMHHVTCHHSMNGRWHKRPVLSTVALTAVVLTFLPVFGILCFESASCYVKLISLYMTQFQLLSPVASFGSQVYVRSVSVSFTACLWKSRLQRKVLLHYILRRETLYHILELLPSISCGMNCSAIYCEYCYFHKSSQITPNITSELFRVA